MIVAPGSTQVSVDVFFGDDTGAAVTGKVAADFPACKWSNGDNTADTTITLSDLAAITTAHPNNNTAGGVHEREGGWYRLDLPNNMVSAAGRKTLTFAESSGKRIIAPFIDCQYPQTNAVEVNGTPQTARDLGASVLISAGTGAGQLDVAAGVVKSSLTQILGTGLTETVAGYLAAAFKKLFNVVTPTLTADTTGTTLTAVPDTSGTTTLLNRLTAGRAGYLDNLNVGGSVASHADITAINQSASKHLTLATVGQYAPGETYTIECRTYAAADGSAVNADTTPTLTATGASSGNLSGNLSAATNPATGVYRWTYTPGAGPTLEQIRMDVSATISAATFTLSAYTQTVDQATVVWSATDQTHLTAIFNKLPANNIADETLILAAIPTAAQNATAIWQDATAGDFAAANSIGKSLYNAFGANTSVFTIAALANAPSGGGGGGGDPWATAFGGYASDTFGGAFQSFIAAAHTVTFLAPYDPTTGILTLVRGRDYKAAENRALEFYNAAGSWPTLNGTITFLLYRPGRATLAVAGTIISASGPTQQVQIELTHTNLAIPASAIASPYFFEVIATQSNGDQVSLVGPGSCVVLQNAAA